MPPAIRDRPRGRSSWSKGIESVKTFSTVPRPEPRRELPCCLCGGDSFARSWDCGDFAFVRCSRCGLIQQNPQPEPQAVASRYDAEYLRYEEANQYAYRDLELLGLADLGLDGAAAGIFDRAAAEGRKPRVLDVGCATGALLAALRDKGWEPQGVEISAAQASYGSYRYGLPIFAGTLEAAVFPARSFDLVHASHLIEHLNSPAVFLDEAVRVLAPGGILALTTPNADGLQARLLGAEWRSAINDHLYLFSRRSLRALLESRGLEVRAEVTWGGWARDLPLAFVKAPLDRLAKRFGFGDVVAILAGRG